MKVRLIDDLGAKGLAHVILNKKGSMRGHTIMSSVCSNSMHLVEISVLKPQRPATEPPRHQSPESVAKDEPLATNRKNLR